MKTIALFVFFLAALTSASFAQDSGDNSPEKAAVTANDRAYEAAYAKATSKRWLIFSPRTPNTRPTMAAHSMDARLSKKA